MIVYAPDAVGVGRLFLVVLEVPRSLPDLEVTVPGAVSLLDRTPVPARTDQRRFYFRAMAPAARAPIRFAGPIAPLTIAVDVWSFEQLRQQRTLKGTTLPRRWPVGEALPELKTAQTLTDEPLIQQLRRDGALHPEYLELADQAVWDMQPDSTIPRWHWTNVEAGCPVHGARIYEISAFYPWLNDQGQNLRTYTAAVPYRWRIVCPVGRESYPSNEFAAGDFTSGAHPDDGIGGGFEQGGVRYGFVAELAQSYCHQMLQIAPRCARSYVATGDGRYLHKALVALARLAVEYAYLATMTQHRHRNSQSQVERLGQGRFDEGPCLDRAGLTVYGIDQPGYQCALAEAYDLVWPDIDKDTEILPFLRAKGFALHTHQQLRRFLEENLMAVWVQAAMDGATASNQPYSQWGLARLAEMLNYRRGTEFMDWLFDGGGGMRVFVANGFFRDGAPYESSGGYNGMHVTALGPIVESVEHLRSLRPDAYPEDRYPNLTRNRRYHSVFDFPMDTVTIDRHYPRVGDDGGPPAFQRRERLTAQNGGTAAFEHAYKVTGNPKFAWALSHWPGWQPSARFPYSRAEVDAAAARWPADWNDRSRVCDGYGLAILRSGHGRAKRALWMMYGRYRSHCHDDIMHIGLDAHESEILGHLGYPRNWNHWYANWITQLVARQLPFPELTATAQLVADAGPLHVAEALATAFVDRVDAGLGYQVDPTTGQRRCVALVDVDEERFYAVDLYRVFGGQEAWWSFHCQQDEGFRVEGLSLAPQAGGTLAGPEVGYGDEPWLAAHGCQRTNYGYHGPMFGFAHLDNVQRGANAAAWSADWALRDAGGLHFRLTVPPGEGCHQVAVCDGRCPAGGSPYQMKWLLRRAAPSAGVLDAGFASVLELYRGEPMVESVRRLALAGEGVDEARAQCLQVRLRDRTDLLFYSTDPHRVFTAPGGVAFAGRFGLLSMAPDGQPLRASLVGGTLLTYGGRGVTLDSGGESARIEAVDRTAATVTVSLPRPVLEPLAGGIVHVCNQNRRVTLHVAEVGGDQGHAVLKLELDPCIGIGRSRGAADGRVLTDTRFPLRGFRYYHGARIASVEGGPEYAVAGVHSGTCVLLEQAPGTSAAELAAAFPTGSWFSLYDYGVGDRLEWTASASVELAGRPGRVGAQRQAAAG